MRRRVLVFLVLLSIAAGGAAWYWRVPLADLVEKRWPGLLPAEVVEPEPDPEGYARLKSTLEMKRRYLATQYGMAKTPGARAAVEQEARRVLEETLPAMMRCWLGTPWDFNGTAACPGGGRIACGYFVATVLMDAGFNVDHFRLARQASGHIMRSFLPEPACTRLVGRPYEEFTAALVNGGPGIYFVGLDRHVGFLVLDGGGSFRFIHSSGGEPKKVVDEGPDQAAALKASNWREFANLTGTPVAVRAWLNGTRLTVKGKV